MSKDNSVGFGLKAKLIFVSLLFTVGITLLISIALYQVANRELSQELRSKVLATVRLGAEAIDAGRMASLVGTIRPEMEGEERSSIETSDAYRIVSEQLNKIRGTDTDVIRYVYTFVPTEDPNTTFFAVDADVLDLLAGVAAGEEIDDGEISHPGTIFDVSEFEKARIAIRDRISTIDDEYVWDDVYQVNSISGYAPIFDEDGRLLAVLGIDMTDINARNALADVTRMSIIIAAAGILLGLAAAFFMGIFMTRDLISLRKTVDLFGAGDFSARSAIKVRDEIGSLARSFNNMIQTIVDYQDKLVSAERERAEAEFRSKVESERNAESRKYLDNISQGLLMLDGQLRISEQYSASLIRLFRFEGEPTGLNFLDFVYPDAGGNAAEREELSSFLSILIGNTTADEDMIDAINPFKDKEIRAFDGSLIVVDARFLRINRDEVVENLMVIFEDKTGIREAEQKLEDERERYDAELEAIAAILKNGPPLFRDFITEGEALVEKLYVSLDKLGESDTSAHFMREFHSLKGSARSLQLDRLATSAHRIEDLLIGAREQGSFGSEERQAILKSAESVKQGILNIRESIERFSVFYGKDITFSPQQELDSYLASLKDMTAKLGQELGKELVFEPVVEVKELYFLKQLKNPIIHLLRNSIDHGLEDIYERTASGKDPAGKIRLEISKEGREIHIAVRDDGKGIDFGRIRKKAIEKGLIPSDGETPTKELMNLLFLPDFSSKDAVSDISGRGVGLDVVKDSVRQLGGTIRVQTKLGSGTSFLLTIPLKRASDRAQAPATART